MNREPGVTWPATTVGKISLPFSSASMTRAHRLRSTAEDLFRGHEVNRSFAILEFRKWGKNRIGTAT
jgi:hypothetical protein